VKKKKIGTVLDEAILGEAKQRALRENRPLSGLLEDALVEYLHGGGPRADAERSCRLFCSHRSRLDLNEINEILDEDVLAT
jgi:hypothetical protein